MSIFGSIKSIGQALQEVPKQIGVAKSIVGNPLASKVAGYLPGGAQALGTMKSILGV